MKRFVFAVILLASCGKLSYSPYSGSVKSKNLNVSNLAAIQSSTKATTGGDVFSIAVISDTHDYYDHLEDQVEFINGMSKYHFVIVTGDITNLGMQTEYAKAVEILDRLTIPYIVVVGNHDLLGDGDRIFPKLFGDYNFEFTYKNTRLVFYNNNNWESDEADAIGVYPQSVFSGDTSTHRLLFAHVMPHDRDRFTQELVDQNESMVTNYNINYFVCGHNHNGGEVSFGSGSVLVVGSSVKRRILEINVSGGTISNAYISL